MPLSESDVPWRRLMPIALVMEQSYQRSMRLSSSPEISAK